MSWTSELSELRISRALEQRELGGFTVGNAFRVKALRHARPGVRHSETRCTGAQQSRPKRTEDVARETA
jgi:hypothetical protein